MKISVAKILIVISIIIAIIGILFGYTVIKEIHYDPAQKYMVDGSDFSPIVGIFYLIASFIWIAMVFGITSLIIAAIWVAYGIVMLIIRIVKKCKESKQKSLEPKDSE